MKRTFIFILSALSCISCLKDFEDTSFTPEKAVITFSKPSESVDKDARSFEVEVASNLPWRASSSVSWATVSPIRGTGPATLTITVQKNRTVEDREGYIRISVTEDQYADFHITQGRSTGGSANTYYVKVDGNSDASGLSWENATTLGAAFDLAADGDSILVAAGTYSPTAFLTSSDNADLSNKTFEIHSNFALIGGYPANVDDTSFDKQTSYDPSLNVTTLSGDVDATTKAYHVVTVTAAKVEGKKAVLKGFTITGGQTSTTDESYSIGGLSYSKAYGGGIVTGACVIDMADLIVTGNVAQTHAAGIYAKPGGLLTMENIRIISNETKSNAGGMWNCGATVYMNHCTVSGNISAQQAAGYYSIDSNGSASVSRIYNSTFSGNDCTTSQAGRSGGGAYIREYSDAVFVNCTFSGNKAGNGGGIQGYGGNGKNSTLTMISCTITGNTATALGGGISLWNNYNTTNLYNCIVSGNLLAGTTLASDVEIGSAVGSAVPNMNYTTVIVGSALYESYTSAKGGFTFDAATMLSGLGMWGGLTQTHTLVESSSNPACTQGMTTGDLESVGASLKPAVDAAVFSTDQRGQARNANTIGSVTL